MTSSRQFSLAKLFKDVTGIALSLAVLRLTVVPGDDTDILPAVGTGLGMLLGIAHRRMGEGALAGTVAAVGLMYLCSAMQTPAR